MRHFRRRGRQIEVRDNRYRTRNCGIEINVILLSLSLSVIMSECTISRKFRRLYGPRQFGYHSSSSPHYLLTINVAMRTFPPAFSQSNLHVFLVWAKSGVNYFVKIRLKYFYSHVHIAFPSFSDVKYFTNFIRRINVLLSNGQYELGHG